MRVSWRNSRLLLLLESLANLHWAPERDPRAALEPEIKVRVELRANLQSISHKCYLFEVVFVLKST